jgi:hypothetical protein
MPTVYAADASHGYTQTCRDRRRRRAALDRHSDVSDILVDRREKRAIRDRPNAVLCNLHDAADKSDERRVPARVVWLVARVVTVVGRDDSAWSAGDGEGDVGRRVNNVAMCVYHGRPQHRNVVPVQHDGGASAGVHRRCVKCELQSRGVAWSEQRSRARRCSVSTDAHDRRVRACPPIKLLKRACLERGHSRSASVVPVLVKLYCWGFGKHHDRLAVGEVRVARVRGTESHWSTSVRGGHGREPPRAVPTSRILLESCEIDLAVAR